MPADDFAEIRRELAEQRRRIDELEHRLETRLQAAEHKQHVDQAESAEQLRKSDMRFAAIDRAMLGMESTQRANLLAFVHLQGVTAMAVGISPVDWKREVRNLGIDGGGGASVSAVAGRRKPKGGR